MSCPFDEARYNALLDGLEISEVKLSELERTKRIDAEYYRPAFLTLLKIQAENNKRTKPLIELCEKIDVGFVGSMIHAYSDESGIPLLQTQNIHQFFIDTTDPKYIYSWFHEELQKSQIYAGDVLIARSGSIGNAAVVGKNDPQPLNSSDIIIIRPKEALNAYYLCTYINSKFGQIQIERLSSGGVQGHINLGALETVVIPAATPEFQSAIEKTVKLARFKLEQSKRLYAEAEETLLDELGLKNWKPPKESAAVKSFKESFGKSGRLDAEFYQPKYQKLIGLLKKDKQRIGDVSVLAKRQFTPEIGKEFNYIEISDINKVGEISSQSLYGEEAPSRAQWIVKSGDVISSTVRPIRRLSALVTSEQDNFVCSSGFAVLKPESIESEVLFIYLRLPIICELLDLYTSASMYPSISSSDLLDIPIPNVGQSVKKNIVSLVQKARISNKESKRLLELSKRAVESAIEKGERLGMKVLE